MDEEQTGNMRIIQTYPIIYKQVNPENLLWKIHTFYLTSFQITRPLDIPRLSFKEIQTQKIPLTKNKGETMIPLICTTTIEIPLILEIQRTRKVYVYEPREDRDIEVIYLPYFEKRDRKNRD